jgi:hypothetical protein
MSQDDSTARIESYLATLRRLKETSSRREMVEREILLAVLIANRERLAEWPIHEADQQHLVATISTRSEPLPAHVHYREWMSQFLVALNQYEVTLRTGASDQTAALLDQLLNQETLLVKCLQGYIFLTGVVRDEFNDVILVRFGESALTDIDELTHSGFSDDHYWKALLERFVFGFMDKAFAEMLTGEKFRLGREGVFVAVRFPLDAVLAQMPGTDKQIEKTRLQAAFDTAMEAPSAIKAATALSSLLSGLGKPMLPPKAAKHDFDLLARVAALDPLSGKYADVFVDGTPLDDPSVPGGQNADNPERAVQRIEARKEFLKNQMLAMAAGAGLAMGILREDLGKALQGFTAREQENLLAVAGTFEPAALAQAHTLMLEYALCRLLADKIQDEGGKVQVKCLKQRRAARRDVEAQAANGFNRIRQKLFFDEDPASPDWLFFKAKSGQELSEAMNYSNIGPQLSQVLTVLWTKREFKTEVLALVNLQLVAKATQNTQAKLTEILIKLGVVKTGQA